MTTVSRDTFTILYFSKYFTWNVPSLKISNYLYLQTPPRCRTWRTTPHPPPPPPPPPRPSGRPRCPWTRWCTASPTRTSPAATPPPCCCPPSPPSAPSPPSTPRSCPAWASPRPPGGQRPLRGWAPLLSSEALVSSAGRPDTQIFQIVTQEEPINDHIRTPLFAFI